MPLKGKSYGRLPSGTLPPPANEGAEEWDRMKERERADSLSSPDAQVLERPQSSGNTGFGEWLQFVVLGVGPGWVMLDCMFVEVPYFQAVQPEGLKLASRMSVAASLALAIMAPLYLFFRDQYESDRKMGGRGGRRKGRSTSCCASITSYNVMVPTLTCLPLILAVVASFTWDATVCFGKNTTSCTSMAIYIITFAASTVGTMQTIVILPWMTKTFAPHHISAIMSGSNFGSMLSAIIGNFR